MKSKEFVSVSVLLTFSANINPKSIFPKRPFASAAMFAFVAVSRVCFNVPRLHLWSYWKSWWHLLCTSSAYHIISSMCEIEKALRNYFFREFQVHLLLCVNVWMKTYKFCRVPKKSALAAALLVIASTITKFKMCPQQWTNKAEADIYFTLAWRPVRMPETLELHRSIEHVF